MVIGIRNKANRALGEVLAPVKQWLEQLARRLEIEGDMATSCSSCDEMTDSHTDRERATIPGSNDGTAALENSAGSSCRSG